MTVAPDSSVAGDLLPGPGVYRYTYNLTRDPSYWSNAATIDGDALDDFLQQVFAGITNLPPSLVRPRWQPEPPPQPNLGTDWMAVGVTAEDEFRGGYWEGYTDDQAYLPPYDTQMPNQSYARQDETMTILVSCYGPHADWYDGLIRDGLGISQNREVFYLAAMGLVEWWNKRIVPELVNAQWLRRIDREIRVNRELRRAYPVLTLLEADGVVITEEEEGLS